MTSRARIFANRARVFATEQEASIDPADAGGGVSTLATLTKTFANNESTSITLSEAVSLVPTISAYKEIPQEGITSKGNWDVDTTASNYEQYNEASINYSGVSLTPSNATGDGSFTNSNPIVSGYNISLISNGYIRQINATSFSGGKFNDSAEFSSDGTKIYFSERNNDKIKVFSLSTPYDITTIAGTSSSEYTLSSDAWAIRVNSTGTKMWVAYDALIEQFTFGTAHDVSTVTSDGTWSIGTFIRDIRFNDDGTKIYIADVGSDDIKQYSLTTAYDITGTKTLDGSITGLTNPSALLFNNDGSKLYYGQENNSSIYVKTLGTPYDITTNVSSGTTVAWDSSANAGNYQPIDMSFNADGTKMFILHSENGGLYHKYLSEFTSGSSNAFDSSDVGKRVVGNSGEAIITSTDGSYSLVSNFASTNTIAAGDWSLFGTKGKSDGTGITLSGISTSDIYNLSAASYDNKSFDASSQLPGAQGVAFKDDGTAMYLIGYTNDTVYQYTLSTAWDVSTASYSSKSFSVASQDGVPRDIRFKSDGTSFYVIASTAPDSIYQYNLSTAWDVSTASYSNKSFSVQTQTDNPAGLAVSADGTKFYVCHYGDRSIYQYDLTTAWDISTASYNNKVLARTSGGSQQESIDISSDGLKFFVSTGIDDAVLQYDLSTAWDISTASTTHSASLTPTDLGMAAPTEWASIAFSSTGHKLYTFSNQNEIVYQISTGAGVSYTHPYSQYFPTLTNSIGQIDSSNWTDLNSMVADETKGDGDVFYAVSTDNRTTWNVISNSDGVRPIARNNANTWQYNSSASYGTNIWTNSTSNDEHQALQQALSSQAVNRMDKAQLQAVTDPNHFTLGDTLDLMIAPYVANGTSLPISDGVTIGYDASALQRLATPGVDYQADVANTTTVNITSLAAQNLKVRIL